MGEGEGERSGVEWSGSVEVRYLGKKVRVGRVSTQTVA